MSSLAILREEWRDQRCFMTLPTTVDTTPAQAHETGEESALVSTRPRNLPRRLLLSWHLGPLLQHNYTDIGGG